MAPNKRKFPWLMAAIVWDMIGGPYEFKHRNTHDRNFKMFINMGYDHEFTDDSILTVAVALGLKDAYGKSPEEIVKAVTIRLKEFGKKYPNGTFPGYYGGTFGKWVKLEGTATVEETYAAFDGKGGMKSWGDGSAMRVSPVAFMCNSLAQVLELAKLSALPSHSHPVAINGAQAIAAAAYLARAGVSKADIKVYLETKFYLDLDKTLAEHTKYIDDELSEQSEGCTVCAEMAIRAFLEGDGFEDCGRRAIAAGGDSDTIGAMVGGIAGAYYGMPEWFEKECEKRLDETMLKGVMDFQEFTDSIDTEPDMGEIEVAIARAKLEKYVLEEYKKGNRIVPKDDPKFLDLLTEMEATRMVWDEVKDARKKNALSEDSFAENKEAWINEVKSQIKNSKELLKQYGKMAACPMRMDPLVDTDAHYRPSNHKKSIPDEWPHVIHEMIPDNIVKDRSLIHGKLSAEIGKFSGKYDEFTIAGQKTESYYKKVTENMLSDKEMGACFDLKNLPKELKNAKDYLQHEGEASAMDPYDALYELKELSKQLNGKMKAAGSAELKHQIKYVDQLMTVVDASINAPKDPDNEIHNMVYHELRKQEEKLGHKLWESKDTGSKAFELAKRAQQSLQKMKAAVADDFANQNIEDDEALPGLAKGNDYAVIFLNQKVQKYTEIANMDLYVEDPQKRDSIRESIMEAKKYLRDFESKGLNAAIEEVKKDEAFRAFENELSIFRIQDAVCKPEGMLQGYRKVVEEELKNVNDFKDKFIIKDGDNKQYTLEEYKAGIRAIENKTREYSNNADILRACGKAAEALLAHVATSDEKIKDFTRSAGLANDNKISKAIQDILKKTPKAMPKPVRKPRTTAVLASASENYKKKAPFGPEENIIRKPSGREENIAKTAHSSDTPARDALKKAEAEKTLSGDMLKKLDAAGASETQKLLVKLALTGFIKNAKDSRAVQDTIKSVASGDKKVNAQQALNQVCLIVSNNLYTQAKDNYAKLSKDMTDQQLVRNWPKMDLLMSGYKEAFGNTPLGNVKDYKLDNPVTNILRLHDDMKQRMDHIAGIDAEKKSEMDAGKKTDKSAMKI